MVTENKFENSTENDLGYGHLFRILVRRLPWLLGILGVTLIATSILTLRQKPTYQSSMQLLIEPNYPRSQNLTDVSNQVESERDEDYATQINLMRSRQFVQKAVESLKTQYPVLDTDAVLSSLTLSQVTEGSVKTKIFQAVYTADDPLKAQKLLQALLKVYQDYNLQQQELRLNRGLASIDQQLRESRNSLTQAQQNLERFLSRYALFQPEQQAAGVLDSLTKAQQAQQTTFVEYEDARARFTALQQQTSLTPQAALLAARLSQSPRYQTLLGELQKTDLELAQRRVIYNQDDPGVQALLDRRRNQLALLQSEITRTIGTASLNSMGNIPSSGGSPLSPTDLTLVNQMVELRSTLLGLSAKSQGLNKIEGRLRTELSRFPRLIAEYDRLKPEVESEQNKLRQLLALRQELTARLAQGGFTWQVVEQPGLGWNTGPDLKKNLLFGLIVGIFLGGLAAFLREVADSIVRTPNILQEQTKLPLLGVIPDTSLVRKKALTGSGILTSNSMERIDCRLPSREALDFAYSNIQHQSEQSSIKSLVVTSAVAGEGKTTIAIEMALSAARLHKNVLLVDANLRQPAIHQCFQISNDKGLTTLLSGEMLDISPQNVDLSGLKIDVLPAGPMVEDPVRLLSSYRMKALIAEYESQYDLILVDSPACSGSLDAAQLAGICGGVLFVARLNVLTKNELSEAVSRLSKFEVVGVIANFVK